MLRCVRVVIHGLRRLILTCGYANADGDDSCYAVSMTLSGDDGRASGPSASIAAKGTKSCAPVHTLPYEEARCQACGSSRCVSMAFHRDTLSNVSLRRCFWSAVLDAVLLSDLHLFVYRAWECEQGDVQSSKSSVRLSTGAILVEDLTIDIMNDSID